MNVTDQSDAGSDAEIEADSAAGLTIRVLGPLRVIRGETELDPGPRRSRTVLALLVSEIGRVVTTERLIDGIWGDEPPPTAKKAVHVHISNLRRALGEDFPLRTAPGGYVVQAAGVDVDAVRFKDETDRGTRLLRTDPSAASRLFAEALRLWDGPAYADLGDEPALVPEITRLTELRLRVVEHRIDADMRLGRHAEVVGELETLTVDHPYRERFRELQMLALYRSGRQAEALRAYEHTRTALADELGLDPSPALREMQHQILEQSGSLELDESGAERYAFLATDLEDSTAMWDTETESMQAALARHDQLIDEAVQRFSGRVFKGTGDGVLAVFGDFADAANAAATAQRDLTRETWPTKRPLRVRMAVDEGPATRRDDDYFGPAMNRVNRIMSSGHGGQVLLPSALADASPIPAASLGAADYKGLGRIDVSQLDIADLPGEFPELRTQRAPAPLERDGFGRSIRGYELRERLGEGAHGFVYRAYQASIGREVAVKVIRPEFANRTDFVKRFEAEAQFIAQLEHPHIVSLYDYWRDLDGAYLAMQLLRGGSLASSLERAPWRPPAALHLLDQVGTALDYAHRHGVVHRDLKPANVLLDDEGNAYLTDFGIATQHVEAVGLPVESSAAYVSPEELAGAPIGTAADVYGLGLLTYEILTGQRPALGAQPRPVAEARHDLPAALDPVFAQATDPDPERRYARVDDYLRALRRVFGADVIMSRRSVPLAEVRNPFKGLRAFGETDSDDFFGREELTKDLIAHVASHNLTAVVGPSGCGKSSLVRAGLLPAVRRGALGTGDDVLITEMFPGSFPFEELEAALMRVAVRGDGALLSDLLADDRGLLRASKQILPNDDSQLLLIIDQFEELFSLTTDERVRRQFLASLTTAVGDSRGRIRVVVTMRADFLDRPLAEADFGAILGAALVPVAMPTREELGQAIARPAAAAGLELEQGLVPRIVADVVDQPGALPMLQHSLTELFAQRSDSGLTLEAYERTGGVRGALAARAEEIYGDLSWPAQQVARQLFLRLVSVDDDSDDTRRRVRRSELDSLGLNESALDTVVDEYGSFRLLSFDRDPVTRGPTIEVAHEALIREWPRYREWVDERREDLLLERRLDVATGEWEDNDRDPSFLFTGGRLEQYEQWSASIDTRLTQSEESFLDTGRAADDSASAKLRSRRRRVLVAVSTLGLIALVFAAAAIVQRNDAEEQASLAEAQADLADEQSLLAEEAADQAAAESERAVGAEGDAEMAREAETAARSAAERSALVSSVRSMALKAEDIAATDQEAAILMAIAASDVSESARLDIPEVMSALLATTSEYLGRHRFELRPIDDDNPVEIAAAAAIGPASDRMVALVSGDTGSGVIAAIIDLESGEVVRSIEGVLSPVSVYWDRERDQVLIGAEGGEVSTWNPTTGERLDAFQAGGPRPLIFETSGSFVSYGTDEDTTGLGFRTSLTVVLNRDTGERAVERRGGDIAKLSPSGNFALVTDTDDVVYVYDLPSGTLRWEKKFADFAYSSLDWVADNDAFWLRDDDLFRVDLVSGVVESVDDATARWQGNLNASPDGRWLSTSSVGSSVSVYKVDDLGTEFDIAEFVLAAQSDGAFSVEWLPDGSGLVSVTAAGDAVLWDLTGQLAWPERLPMQDYPVAASFLDDRSLSIIGFVNGGDLRDVKSGTSIAAGGLGSFPADTFDVLASGRPLLARSKGSGQGLEVVDLETGEVISADEPNLDRPLALTPAGDFMAASTTVDGVVKVYGTPKYAVVEVETGRRIVEVDNEHAVGAAFSPDGEHVVISSGEPLSTAGVGVPLLIVYDATTGAAVSRLELDFYTTEAVEFSADGERLVVGGHDSELVVFDFETLLDDPELAVIGRTTVPQQADVVAAAFTADGSSVVVSSFDTSSGPVNAFSVADGLPLLWTFVTGAPVVDIEIHDEMLWLPRFDGLGLALTGMPLDRATYTEFARSRVTREFPAAECERYLGEPCPTPEAR
jgi:serine/threonine protein kinase/DNA-binding SARP family transcriptional activator/WD40 repeat protein